VRASPPTDSASRGSKRSWASACRDWASDGGCTIEEVQEKCLAEFPEAYFVHSDKIIKVTVHTC